MPHVNPRDWSRCAGRDKWDWPTRSTNCNRCGAHEPSKRPKFKQCGYRGMVAGERCVLGAGHPGAHNATKAKP